MKKIVLLLLFSICLLQLYSTNYDSLFIHANKHYSAEQFDKAIKLYDSVLLEYQSPKIYYNLANAYYKQKQIAYAILNYERAYRMDPNDDDISYNLELTQTHVVDKIDKIPELFIYKWMKNVSTLNSSDNWAKISVVTFIIFLITFSLYLYVNKIGFKKIAFWFSLILIFISIFSYVFAYKQKNEFTTEKFAIIFSPTVTVKSSPNENGTDLFLLHEGTKVSVGETVGDWREIRLSDGNKGWVKTSTFEII